MPFQLFNTPKDDSKLSAYERERLENIKAVRLELGGVFLDLDNATNALVSSTKKMLAGNAVGHLQNRRRKIFKKQPNEVQYIRRSARIRRDSNKSIYKEGSDSDDDDEHVRKKQKKHRQGSLVIKFPWAKNKDNKERDEEFYNALNDSDFLTDDEIDYYDSNPKRQRLTKSVPVQLPVSKITPEMISNVHYSSCGKKYSESGTTCHQCRQKTLDQKSYCRHKGCRGVRGMFCGFCLGKRYGENVAEVLLEKKWACPPCRGYCNCSICRRRQGKPPTGQLAAIAEAKGFKSVRHMLVEIEGENSNLLSDEEAEKESVSEVSETETDDVQDVGGENTGIQSNVKDVHTTPTKSVQNLEMIQSSNEAAKCSITPSKLILDQKEVQSDVKDVHTTPIKSVRNLETIQSSNEAAQCNTPSKLILDQNEVQSDVKDVHTTPIKSVRNVETIQSSNEAAQCNTPTKLILDKNVVQPYLEDVHTTTSKSVLEQVKIQSSNELHHESTKLSSDPDLVLSDLQCAKPLSARNENSLDNTSLPTTKRNRKPLRTVVCFKKKRQTLAKKPFKSLHSDERNKLILSWFCTDDVVDKALSTDFQINDFDLNKYNSIPNNVIDEMVDLFQVKQFFSSMAWTKVQKIVAQKKSYNSLWLCPLCKKKCTNNAISCDYCLTWYHTKCVNLTSVPKRNWYCQHC